MLLDHASNFGTKLKAARQAAGMTVRQLAEAIAVSPSWVSMVETGKSLPGPERVGDIARALGIDEGEFLRASLHPMYQVGNLDALLKKSPFEASMLLAHTPNHVFIAEKIGAVIEAESGCLRCAYQASSALRDGDEAQLHELNRQLIAWAGVAEMLMGGIVAAAEEEGDSPEETHQMRMARNALVGLRDCDIRSRAGLQSVIDTVKQMHGRISALLEAYAIKRAKALGKPIPPDVRIDG